MSDIVKSLEWSCRDPVTHEPIDDGDYSNATVSEVKQAIAEITRLRAELDTARRQGMEEAAQWHDQQAAEAQKLADMKVSALDEQENGSTLREFRKVWGDYAENHREFAAAIRAAAKEGKP